MRTFNFKVDGNNIKVLDYPDAEGAVLLPEDKYTKQLVDYYKHWWDLQDSKKSLESMRSDYSEIINKALAQNAIISFYKCFESSKGRNTPLSKKKILAKQPPEASIVFDYYKRLRDRFIAHDESNLTLMQVGGIIDGKNTPAFIDTIIPSFFILKYQGKQEIAGLNSFMRLVDLSLRWTDQKTDELNRILYDKYSKWTIEELRKLPPLRTDIPKKDNLLD